MIFRFELIAKIAFVLVLLVILADTLGWFP